MKANELRVALQKALQRPIAFNPWFARISGSVEAGIFLSQAFYWSDKTDENGWFYKTREEWTEETCLGRRGQENSRRILLKLGVLEEERRGVPAKMYYRVVIDKLMEMLTLDCPDRAIQLAQSEPSSRRTPNQQYKESETTTETTAEIDSFSLRSKEEEVKPSTKVKEESKPKSKADPRHQEVKLAIEGCWTLANPGAAAMPWNGREAGALGQVLSSNPSWPVGDLVACVQNRFASEVNNAERPGVWIPKLTDYFGGPLDRFNKPYGQQKSNAEIRQQRNRENIMRAHAGGGGNLPQSRPGGFADEQGPYGGSRRLLEGVTGEVPGRKD